MAVDIVVRLHGGQLAPQLRVLHPQSSDLAALHFHVGQEVVVLILQVLDRVSLTLVFRNGCDGKSVSVRNLRRITDQFG